MSQTVFINGRFLSQRVTGVQRYARETLAALDAQLSVSPEMGIQWVLLAPPGTVPPPLSAIEFRHVGSLTGNAWEQLSLPRAARNGLLFSFSATGPLFMRRQIVTLHDAAVDAVPHAFSVRFRSWYRLVINVFSRSLPMIITVSDFSRDEIARRFHCDLAKLRVTTEGWQHILRHPADASVLTKYGLKKDGYVLAVSSVTPNKNFQLVVDAVHELNNPEFQVVIAGSNNSSVFGSADLSKQTFVKPVGYVSDAELRALYENAAVFVYPSLYEGFGLPALEAMALGCPVVASDSAAGPEVCGDAAVYVSPYDAKGLARILNQLTSDSTARAELTARGLDRVQGYSWQQAARLNLSFIQECLALMSGSTFRATRTSERPKVTHTAPGRPHSTTRG
jgi:glycosyltransferase involved in cell wall biosynthesis